MFSYLLPSLVVPTALNTFELNDSRTLGSQMHDPRFRFDARFNETHLPQLSSSMNAVFTMKKLSLEDYKGNIRDFTSRMYSYPEVQSSLSPTQDAGALQRGIARQFHHYLGRHEYTSRATKRSACDSVVLSFANLDTAHLFEPKQSNSLLKWENLIKALRDLSRYMVRKQLFTRVCMEIVNEGRDVGRATLRRSVVRGEIGQPPANVSTS